MQDLHKIRGERTNVINTATRFSRGSSASLLCPAKSCREERFQPSRGCVVEKFVVALGNILEFVWRFRVSGGTKELYGCNRYGEQGQSPMLGLITFVRKNKRGIVFAFDNDV